MMGISRDKRLIDVDVTIHYLLENSLFAKYIYGHPRPSRGTHRIILDITDVSAINTLTQITTLADPDTKDEWPVKCYILTYKRFHSRGHKNSRSRMGKHRKSRLSTVLSAAIELSN